YFSFVWGPLDHIHSKPPESRTFFLCMGSSRPHSQQAAEVTNVFPLYKMQMDTLDHIHSKPLKSHERFSLVQNAKELSRPHSQQATGVTILKKIMVKIVIYF